MEAPGATRHHDQADVTHVFPSLRDHPLPIGWGEGQGEGSSEILQTGLDSVVMPSCARKRPTNKLPLPSSTASCLTPPYECQSWDLGQAHQADCHAPAAGCAAPDRAVVSAAHTAQRKNAQGQHDFGCRGQKRGRNTKAT